MNVYLQNLSVYDSDQNFSDQCELTCNSGALHKAKVGTLLTTISYNFPVSDYWYSTPTRTELQTT